ncbi:MAG TPA: methyltransferase domain-containing protein [Alphaproteobacteria bacterium]
MAQGFRSRLRAWWHGLDMEVAPEPQVERPVPPAPAAERTPDGAAWSPMRIKAAELVIGDDCRTPIGPDKAVEALKPLGLTNAKAVLEVGAGLGNAARHIAAVYGAWVSGYESSASLAEQAMARSVAAGMAKKAPIIHVDLEALKQPETTFDCVYGREPFFTVKNKSALFETLVGAMKAGGELVFTDYMLRAPDVGSATVREWTAGEPVEPHPWTLEQLVALLRKLRLDVRVSQDYSKQFRDLAVRRLEALVTKNETLSADPSQTELLLREVEMWGRRVNVLDSGDVQVHRIYARKSGGADGKIRGMSNW